MPLDLFSFAVAFFAVARSFHTVSSVPKAQTMKILVPYAESHLGLAGKMWAVKRGTWTPDWGRFSSYPWVKLFLLMGEICGESKKTYKRL